MFGRKIITSERSLLVRLAKIAFGSGFLAVRWANQKRLNGLSLRKDGAYPGATYHVMAPGDGGDDLFETDDDRKSFLFRLGEVGASHGWRVHSSVLSDDEPTALPF